MTGVDDLLFIAAAYGAILGAVSLYAATLVRRLRRARESATAEERPEPTS
jgi:hypothetical protein